MLIRWSPDLRFVSISESFENLTKIRGHMRDQIRLNQEKPSYSRDVGRGWMSGKIANMFQIYSVTK